LLFVDASFQLNPGEKVGLVGPNGAGKTTLFRMVVGEETPDEGAVSVPKKLTLGYFRQDVESISISSGPSAEHSLRILIANFLLFLCREIEFLERSECLRESELRKV
jgi:ABC-type Mn2+/Zn2+ transport system ATPase subunit